MPLYPADARRPRSAPPSSLPDEPSAAVPAPSTNVTAASNSRTVERGAEHASSPRAASTQDVQESLWRVLPIRATAARPQLHKDVVSTFRKLRYAVELESLVNS